MLEKRVLFETLTDPNDYKIFQVKTLCQKPEIPVGGRLKLFWQNWEKITNDVWVLKIIKEGYKLEFLQKIPQTGIRKTNVCAKDLTVLLTEINQLFGKGAIEIVPAKEKQKGFYSTFFLVPKKTGDLRPIINLRPLNKYLQKKHFKMDSLNSVLNLVKKGDWALSLDLKDAYFHIPIHPSHKQYLRFCVNNQCYQFRVLCFGPTSAPRVFTKVCAIVAAHLRAQNIRLAAYLDDWFVVNQNKGKLVADREKAINLLIKLGFIINVEKSNLNPTQSIIYIGADFSLQEGLVRPTQERVVKLQAGVKNVLNKQSQATAKDYLHLLGIMASCIELIPNARLFMRPVQLHLLFHWKPSCRNLDQKIPFSCHLKGHLKWWLKTENTNLGRVITPQKQSITVTTDASKSGYGGHIGNNQTVQGFWSETEKQLHINCLEMEAVYLTIQHFQDILKNKQILIRSDNTTVVRYINKQGGTHSPDLCMRTWKLWQYALDNQMNLKSAHIAGKKNILADNLSRIKIRPTEWTLNKQVVRSLFRIWGEPIMDLFAAAGNYQTQIYCSWIPDPHAYAIDALTISWNNMFAYAFPPICLIPKILQHMNQFNCQIILITPHWPRRLWFPNLLQYVIDYPRTLPVKEDLLHQPKTNIVHPNPAVFKLTAWLLSTNISKRRDFLKTLENYSKPHGVQGHRRTTLLNLENSIAGVVEGKLIPIMPL